MKLTHTIIDTMTRFEPREDYFSDVGLTHLDVESAMREDYPEEDLDTLEDIDVLLTIDRALGHGVERDFESLPSEMQFRGSLFKVCRLIEFGRVVLTEAKYGRETLTVTFRDEYEIFYDDDYCEQIVFPYSKQCSIRAIRDELLKQPVPKIDA